MNVVESLTALGMTAYRVDGGPTNEQEYNDQVFILNDQTKPTWNEIQTKWSSISSVVLGAPVREQRNTLLADSDWTQANDSPLAAEKKVEWATYRTALRNLPDHSNWPNLEDDDWPTKPE
jgi:hypothetical protein|tara:strand:- start:501 stop:860 length:360 start_codon:yes stop_codon:yes gene_type:complete